LFELVLGTWRKRRRFVGFIKGEIFVWHYKRVGVWGCVWLETAEKVQLVKLFGRRDSLKKFCWWGCSRGEK
jgi:hypothetical protein